MIDSRRQNRTRARGRAGATLIEVTLSATLMLLTAGATIQAVTDMRGAATVATTSSKLSEQGERALERIIADLRRSGFVTLGALSYPHLFEEGDAASEFDHHDHAPAEQAVDPGDPEYVVPRSIVFVQPADEDAPGAAGFGRPDVDANGRLVWDAREFSYVVVTVNGRNRLERRTDAVDPVTVCTDVDWIRFDDAATPGVNLPADALRIRLGLRDLDASGRVVTWFGEAVVRLRNR